MFDRSAPLPAGGQIHRSDGTSRMAFYCLVMLKIALEPAKDNSVYQDTASKFLILENRIYLRDNGNIGL